MFPDFFLKFPVQVVEQVSLQVFLALALQLQRPLHKQTKQLQATSKQMTSPKEFIDPKDFVIPNLFPPFEVAQSTIPEVQKKEAAENFLVVFFPNSQNAGKGMIVSFT
jgi:hypothetical protein